MIITIIIITVNIIVINNNNNLWNYVTDFWQKHDHNDLSFLSGVEGMFRNTMVLNKQKMVHFKIS